jgi:hypothetical protein
MVVAFGSTGRGKSFNTSEVVIQPVTPGTHPLDISPLVEYKDGRHGRRYKLMSETLNKYCAEHRNRRDAVWQEELLTESQAADKREALRLFQVAYEAQMRGDLDEAVDLYKQSIEAFPTAEAHRFLVGLTAWV